MGRIRSTHSSMPLSGSLGDRDRAASGVRFACWSTLYHSQPVKGLSRTRRLAYSGGLVRSGLLSMPSLWSEKASVLDYLHWNRNMLLCRQVLIPNDSRVSTDLRMLERLRTPLAIRLLIQQISQRKKTYFIMSSRFQ